MNDNRWVESRMSALDTEREWHPNAAAALEKFEQRKRAARSRRKRLLWATATAAAICIGALWMPVSGSCAPPPATCPQRLWQKLLRPEPVVAEQPAPVLAQAPVAVAETPPPKAAPPQQTKLHRTAPKVRIVNFKETGAASAAVTCEVYTDYQCPACATMYRDTIPLLVAEYVQTGKVKLLHRDFPLPAHAYGRLAARYANAAGQLGYYDAAVNQIFATQPQWSATGDVASAVAQALPPAVMQKVREMIERDSKLDATLEADVAAGRDDQLRQTPSFVVVAKGKRQLLPGSPSYSLLKTYLDQVLAER